MDVIHIHMYELFFNQFNQLLARRIEQDLQKNNSIITDEGVKQIRYVCKIRDYLGMGGGRGRNPMSHGGGIATRKVFARTDSFCALLPNPQLKYMPEMHRFLDGLETFQMVWKLSG